MRVYINGRFLSQRITGVQRYAFEIVKYLDEALSEYRFKSEVEFILIAPKNVKFNIFLKHIKYINKGRMTGHLWEQIELPIFTRNGFLLNLCNTASVFKKNQAVTIHDAAVYACPNGFSLKFRIWYKFIFFILGKRLECIFTVSNFSAKELQKYCDIPEEKIHVNYLGVNHILKIKENKDVLEKYNIPEGKFVLAVSSLNRNKNFKIVLETAKIKPQITFVIAGGVREKIFSTMNIEPINNVKYIGYVTDGDLVGLYKKASCFLYPSLYEGFGLPPLEAMVCGCPVIVSNCAALPEICQDDVLYCDFSNAKNIAKKIDDLFTNEKYANKYIKGQSIIEKYHWEQTVRGIIEVLFKRYIYKR